MNKEHHRKPINITRREAPYFDGFYAVQAIPNSPDLPTVTSYRKTIEGADEAKARFLAMRQWRYVAVRCGYDAWDVYNSTGKRAGLYTTISTDSVPDLSRPLDVDPAKLDADAQWGIGRKCQLVITAEYHAGTSARRIQCFHEAWRLMVKPLPGRLPVDQFLYLVEPGDLPCRVMGLYADIKGRLWDQVNSSEKRAVEQGRKLSHGMSEERAAQLARAGADLLDRWADMRKAIVNETLADTHSERWYTMLEHTLVYTRWSYLSRIFAIAARLQRDDDALAMLMDLMPSNHEEFRRGLARALLLELGDKFNHVPGQPETLDESVIAENSRELVTMLRLTWQLWRESVAELVG